MPIARCCATIPPTSSAIWLSSPAATPLSSDKTAGCRTQRRQDFRATALHGWCELTPPPPRPHRRVRRAPGGPAGRRYVRRARKIGAPATSVNYVPLARCTKRRPPAGMSCTELGLLHRELCEIDQVDVGAQPRRQPAAIGQAEVIGGLAGLAFDDLLDRQPRPAAPVSAPDASHECRHAGIDMIREKNPKWSPRGFICLADLNLFRTRYVTDVLKAAGQEVLDLEQGVAKSLEEEGGALPEHQPGIRGQLHLRAAPGQPGPRLLGAVGLSSASFWVVLVGPGWASIPGFSWRSLSIPILTSCSKNK